VSGTYHVVGIDLSGPTNVKDTVFLAFEALGTEIRLSQAIQGAKDHDIHAAAEELLSLGKVVVGLDAPLSYNPGGGDRPGDKILREKVIRAGLHPGSVMTPTMTRMAYLTLRGTAIARILSSFPEPKPKIVEVHPGAAMALRGAAITDLRAYKMDPPAQQRLLGWLKRQGLDIKDMHKTLDSHHVDACAAALAAWKWHLGDAVWVEPASPPHHPFDYAC
jgi:predicted nuclease with RNAse H fold